MTIECYTGDPGAGKTYLMTKRALKLMKKGHRVYANYPLEGAIPWKFVDELYAIKREPEDKKSPYILMSEASLLYPCGSHKAIPFEVVANWREHRHRGINILWDAQDFSDVAVALRRVTQFQNSVSRFGWLILYKCFHPRKKTKYGGGMAIFDLETAKKYDSWAEGVAKQKYL